MRAAAAPNTSTAACTPARSGKRCGRRAHRVYNGVAMPYKILAIRHLGVEKPGAYRSYSSRRQEIPPREIRVAPPASIDSAPAARYTEKPTHQPNSRPATRCGSNSATLLTASGASLQTACPSSRSMPLTAATSRRPGVLAASAAPRPQSDIEGAEQRRTRRIFLPYLHLIENPRASYLATSSVSYLKWW